MHFSNIDEITAAKAELNKALTRLHDLELSAMATNEITQALKDLTRNLTKPLQAIDMNPPTLDKHGVVIPPKPDGQKIILDEVA